MPREASAEHGSAPPVTEGINRRTLAAAGVATLMCTLAAPAGAPEMPPTCVSGGPTVQHESWNLHTGQNGCNVDLPMQG
jgi:hypothetical protein